MAVLCKISCQDLTFLRQSTGGNLVSSPGKWKKLFLIFFCFQFAVMLINNKDLESTDLNNFYFDKWDFSSWNESHVTSDLFRVKPISASIFPALLNSEDCKCCLRKFDGLTMITLESANKRKWADVCSLRLGMLQQQVVWRHCHFSAMCFSKSIDQ